MRQMIWVVIASVLFTGLLFGGKSKPLVEASYNKFKDVSTNKSRPVTRGGFQFNYDCPGNVTGCVPEAIFMNYARYSTSWLLMYARGLDLVFLVDGKPLTLQGLDWRGIPVGNGVEEWLSGTLTVEEFRSLASAQQVEVEIGSTLHPKVTDKDLQAWKDFAATIPVP